VAPALDDRPESDGEMRTRRMPFGDVEATVVEGTPIGTICVAPVLLEEGVSLTHEERRLLDRKTRLLLELLQDEPFLAETASLYSGKLDQPPILVLFGRFPPDERGAGFLGRTRDREIDIEGVKLQVIELNLLEDNHHVRDSERKLVLWSGFLSLALCHSSGRPHEPGAVVDWSDAQAKRAWLLALRRGRLGSPRKRYIMGLERLSVVRGRIRPVPEGAGSLLLTFPAHFVSRNVYLSQLKRGQEHVPVGASWDEKSDFIRTPPWRWNNTAAFVELHLVGEGDLVADIHIATTVEKVVRHASIEPAGPGTSSGKVFRYFSSVSWESALGGADPLERLERFLDLIDTYVESVFGWSIELDRAQVMARRLHL
jgi:hypothetical protein